VGRVVLTPAPRDTKEDWVSIRVPRAAGAPSPASPCRLSLRGPRTHRTLSLAEARSGGERVCQGGAPSGASRVTLRGAVNDGAARPVCSCFARGYGGNHPSRGGCIQRATFVAAAKRPARKRRARRSPRSREREHIADGRRRVFSAILRKKVRCEAARARQRRGRRIQRVARRSPSTPVRRPSPRPQGASNQGEEVCDVGGWQRSRPNAIPKPTCRPTTFVYYVVSRGL